MAMHLRGKRSCIGQNLAMLEMRVIASVLMRNFDFQVVEEPDLELFVTMKPISLKMQVSKRAS
jgi:cytochrome P450